MRVAGRAQTTKVAAVRTSSGWLWFEIVPLAAWLVVATGGAAAMGCRAASVSGGRGPTAETAGASGPALRLVPLGLCEDYPEESRSVEVVRKDMELLRAAGVRVLRVSIGWDGLEVEKDRYDWAFWDAFVDLAVRQNGVRLIPYVAYTPRWNATGGPADYWKSPPRDLAELEEVMSLLAARYRDTISSWEIWNEPDNRDYWLGSAADYARLLEAGARGVRRGNPAAAVVSGGIAGGTQFLDEVMAAPAGRMVDVVNAHAYPETWSPHPIEALPEYVREIGRAAERHGRRRVVWIAEVGYSDYRRGPAVVSEWVGAKFGYEHTAEFQAVALLRTVGVLLATDVSLIAWYEVKDPPAADAMIGDDNNRHLGVAFADHRPKPALAALRFLAEQTEHGIAEVATTIGGAGATPVAVRAFRTGNQRLLALAWIPTHGPEGARPVKNGEMTAGRAGDDRRARFTLELAVETRGEIALHDPAGRTVGTVAATRAPGRTTVHDLEVVGGGITLLTASLAR